MFSMQTILITATNTDVGKTYTTLKLIPIFAKMGYKVGVMKPIETGVKDSPKDAKILFDECKKYNEKFKDLTLKDISPVNLPLPAAPFIANNLQEIGTNIIEKSFKKIQNYCDLLLVESAGGILTPIGIDFYMIDLAKIFDAKIALISDSRLGMISTLLVHIEFLKSKEFDFKWIINKTDESFDLISKPFLDQKFKKTLTVQQNLSEFANSLLL